nr:hypothetical protein [Micromonospora sp. DSM 115978]
MSLDTVNVYDPQRYVVGIPHADFQLLRAQAPVFRHPDHERPDGFWAVTSHADVVHMSRTPEVFSSHRKTCFLNEFDGDQLAQQQLMMVN